MRIGCLTSLILSMVSCIWTIKVAYKVVTFGTYSSQFVYFHPDARRVNFDRRFSVLCDDLFFVILFPSGSTSQSCLLRRFKQDAHQKING